MSSLKPWQRVPFELIRHSEEHYRAGHDSDRLISYIGFDNSIELSITTYLKLHPQLRNNKSFPSKDVQKWLENYHTKIDFFINYVAERGLPIKIGQDNIIYYHIIRNDLYHNGGSGLIPTVKDLEGIRNVALWIFDILFDTNIDFLLKNEVPSRIFSQSNYDDKVSGKLSFFKAFIQFENVLISKIKELYIDVDQTNTRQQWQTFSKYLSNIYLSKEQEKIVNQSLLVSSKIRHNKPIGHSDKELEKLANDLTKVRNIIENYRSSINILSKLKNQYHRSLKSNISNVVIYNTNQRVYLDITYQIKNKDQKTIHKDLSSETNLPFNSKLTAEENANIFINNINHPSISKIVNELFLFQESVSL